MKHKKPPSHPHGTMKALIIYDDVDSAERAIGFLRRAASLARMHTQWDIKPWRASVLSQTGEPALVVTCANPTTKPTGVSQELLSFASQNNLDLIVQTKPSVVINRLALTIVPAQGESLFPAAFDQDPISPHTSHYGSYIETGK